MKRLLQKKGIKLVYFLTLGCLIVTGIWGDKAAAVIAESFPVTGRTTVVIDAGHGGIDGGAVSYTGVTESQINLEFAKRLQELMHLLGIRTIMTRTEDASIFTSGKTISEKKISDLKERVRIVNDTENCLMISIHQNYYTDSKYSGAQVFYAPTADSEDLAKALQDRINGTINSQSTRQIKKAESIYLMNHILCTGVLLECGFISNPTEAVLLQDAAYQKYMCGVVASTFSCFLAERTNVT